MRIFCNFFIALVGFFSLCTISPEVHAATGKEPVMTSSPDAWVLVDGISGFVMGAHDKDKALSPGELVHLMVIYTALDATAGDKKHLTPPSPFHPPMHCVRAPHVDFIWFLENLIP